MASNGEWIPKIGDKIRLKDVYLQSCYPATDWLTEVHAYLARGYTNCFTIEALDEDTFVSAIAKFREFDLIGNDWVITDWFEPYNIKVKRKISKHKPYIRQSDRKAWRAIISK